MILWVDKFIDDVVQLTADGTDPPVLLRASKSCLQGQCVRQIFNCVIWIKSTDVIAIPGHEQCDAHVLQSWQDQAVAVGECESSHINASQGDPEVEVWEKEEQKEERQDYLEEVGFRGLFGVGCNADFIIIRWSGCVCVQLSWVREGLQEMWRVAEHNGAGGGVIGLVATHSLWIPNKFHKACTITKFFGSFRLGMVYVCIGIKYSHVRYIRHSAFKSLKGGHTTIHRCRGTVEAVGSSTHCFAPQCHRTISVLHHGMHTFCQCSVGPFSNTILLWGVRDGEFKKDPMSVAIVP